jgi:uncharacterized membrane protein YraQ (UPF0718 family)
MDRVRFGRALGQGTREAARALLQAADAATAPNPNPAAPQSAPRPEPSVPRVAAQTRHKLKSTQAGVKAGSRNFVQATMAPVKRASGILFLEVTGTLFALVAFTGAIEIWRFRDALHATGADHRNLLLAVLIFVFFGFCTVSSFVRASRKSRGR